MIFAFEPISMLTIAFLLIVGLPSALIGYIVFGRLVKRRQEAGSDEEMVRGSSGRPMHKGPVPHQARRERALFFPPPEHGS